MKKATLSEQTNRIKEMINVSEQYIRKPMPGPIVVPPLTNTGGYGSTKNIGMPAPDPNLQAGVQVQQPPAAPVPPAAQEGKVYTDFDKVWDYKLENGHWYAKRKDCNWKDITGNKEAVDKLNKRYGTNVPVTEPAGPRPPVKKVVPPVPPVTPQPVVTKVPPLVPQIKPAVADKTYMAPKFKGYGGGQFGGGGAGDQW